MSSLVAKYKTFSVQQSLCPFDDFIGDDEEVREKKIDKIEILDLTNGLNIKKLSKSGQKTKPTTSDNDPVSYNLLPQASKNVPLSV